MDHSTAMLIVCLLIASWLFVFGACVGSFLNVVIYRLPAGLSIVSPPSACPRCGTPIRALDNIPLLSWLLLGGNCRACCCPIPLRYPGVELLVAIGAASIGAGEIFSLGRNLPTATPLVPAGLSPIDEMTLILWGIAAFHFLLWVTLVAMAFIEHDGEKIPATLLAPAFLVGILAPTLWPQIGPMAHQVVYPVLGSDATMPDGVWMRDVSGDMLFGLAIGAAAGVWVSFLVVFVCRRDAGAEIGALSLVGLCLGGQAALLLATGATILWLLLTAIASTFGARIPWTGALAAALIPFLLSWKWLASIL